MGFTKALQYANNIGLHAIEHYNRGLSERLRENLRNSGFNVWDWGENLSSIVTFPVRMVIWKNSACFERA